MQCLSAGSSLAGFVFVIAPAITFAQDARQDTTPQAQTNLDDLKKRLDQLESSNSDEIEDLKFQIATLEKEVAAAKSAAQSKSGQSNNVFNPQITVFGNFLGRADDTKVFAEDDPAGSRIDSRMNLREVEFDMRAPIDPWADAVVILSVESPSPNEFETSIEEGYFTLKKLPIFDTAPGGLKLQVGRFHEEFGRFNKIHLHDLPQPSYPRALTNFLGNDSYVQNGVAGQFFLPSPSESSTLQASVALLDGGDIPIDDTGSGSNLATLGHVDWFNELSDSQSLDLGASAWNGDSDHALYGLDVTYKYKPLAGGEWHSFLLGGEFFGAALDDPNTSDHPSGYYLWSQYQFSQNTYFGLRFDHAEELADSNLSTDTVGAYLTYYTTEFLRFRLGLEHAESDVARLDGRDTALIEMNMVFGSHPTEPYWVNR
ncbi:MAG: hypothetical protein K8S98_15585 [Planctomycetes bacterium]|nr:hypothetical protein [Planctomycetota bacterium]